MQQLLTLAVAVYNIFALSEWNLRGFMISGFQLAALVAIYSTLLPKRQDNRDRIPFVDIEKFAVPVAVRTCACLLFFLGLQTIVIGSVPFDIWPMIAVAVFKAVSLLFLVQTVKVMLETKPRHVLTRLGTSNIMGGLNGYIRIRTRTVKKPLFGNL